MWKIVEEHVDAGVTAANAAASLTAPTIDRIVQNIWGLRYIDDLVLRRVDANYLGSGTPSFADTASGDIDWEQYLTDHQFSVVAAVGRTGTLAFRVAYDAYGEARHLPAKDINGDGKVDKTDTTLAQNASGKKLGQPGYNPDADWDRDGIVSTRDIAQYGSTAYVAALPQGQLAQPGSATQPAAGDTSPTADLARPANARSDFNIGFSGYRFNGDIGAYTVRFRHYDPTPGMCRWLERDPAGYQDGPSLYSYLGRNPMAGTDPYGLWGFVPMSVRIDILKHLTKTRRLLQPGVYWGVRDLDSAIAVVGNHHYLLIVLAETEDWGDTDVQISPLQRGVILAGYEGEAEEGEPIGKLVVRLNATADLEAVREYLGPPQCPQPGWDAELHRVKPPTGTSEEELVMELIERTAAYVRNTSCGPESRVEYRLRTQNCATWVDGLLRSAGILKWSRREWSNFFGLDWGEERGDQLAPQFGSPDWMSWSK